MGHKVGKDLYRRLGKKIDNLPIRAPWSDKFHAILKELYSPKEADVITKMPYGLSDFEQIEKTTGYESSELHKVLENLCSKGLVVDMWIQDQYHFMPSPLIIGIFEFTMMRTGNDLKSKHWAKLFHEYLQEGSFYTVNFKHNEKISFMRALPHEGTVHESEYMEVLDYEKATAIVERSDKFCIGLCSCRHEKHHLGDRNCDIPLKTCSTFGRAADYLIRNNLGEEVSKSAMLENFARSKERGLVFNADNVRNSITYICHCCKCCCNALAGISRFGYPNTIVTSSFIAEIDTDKCAGCGKCAKACPINAIEMVSVEKVNIKNSKEPKINTSICLGCGVCALKCTKTRSLRLTKRKKRVIHPEFIFERIILQCLERGTLQNQIFSNPHSITLKIMSGFIGGFLRIPLVKKVIMSDMFRSKFLTVMKKGIAKQGKGWLTEL